MATAVDTFHESAAKRQSLPRRASRLAAKSLYRRLAASFNRVAAVVRRRYYLDGGQGLAWRLLPLRLRLLLGLDDAAAVGSHRIEIGSGRRPQAGYLHVDPDRLSSHAEFFSAGWDLPFADAWAEEILAIHVLEHIHPTRLRETLCEWHRVLRRGGRLELHVPDSTELMRSYLAARPREKWRLIGALLGMYCDAGVTAPEELQARADHQLLFDAPLLERVLRDAGFSHVQNISSRVTDAHTEGWRDVVERFSLVVEAFKR